MERARIARLAQDSSYHMKRSLPSSSHPDRVTLISNIQGKDSKFQIQVSNESSQTLPTLYDLPDYFQYIQGKVHDLPGD